jgi:eukaryotic-like serine/threonine-protein kinase
MDQENEATKNWNSFIGRNIKNRYQILKKIGEGGIGSVYLAEDRSVLNRNVVIKVLRENWMNDPAVRRKFEHEKEALSRLDHPGIVSILDAGTLPEDKPFFVMPYIAGRTLRQAIEAQKFLPLNVCADIIESFCEALSAAHAAGVLHRDIKPENIILSEQPDQKVRVRLIDFGIARVMDSKISPVTDVERSIGTVLYIAPEQLLGSINQKPSTDIYSCAIVVFEMLTGRLPFLPGSIVEMWQMQSEGLKKLPSEIRPELSPAVDNILLKALAYEPADRFQDVLDFGRTIIFALQQSGDSKKTNYHDAKTEIGFDLITSDAPNTTKKGRLDTDGTVKHQDKQAVFPSTEQVDETGKNFPNEKANEIIAETRESPQSNRQNTKTKAFRQNLFWAGAVGVVFLALLVPALIYFFNLSNPENPATNTALDSNTNQAVTGQELELFFEVQKMRGGKPDGAAFRANGREIFKSGDKFKIGINTEQSGNLYIFNEGKDSAEKNTFYLLFPTQEQQTGSPRVKAGQQILTGGNVFTGAPGR